MKNRSWIINRDEMTPSAEVRTAGQFRLSPNPASEWLQVEGPDRENLNLSLFLPDGRLATRWKNTGNRIDLSTRHLAPGLYFFKIEKTDSSTWQSGKVILK